MNSYAGAKDEPNIHRFYTSKHGTKNVKTHNRTTQKLNK
jgi:hypothetical protein